MSESLSLLLKDIYVLTLGRSGKVIPPPLYKGEEGFWYAAAFRKDYTFSEEPFIFPKDEVYFIGSGALRPVASPNMVAILATILDFTEN